MKKITSLLVILTVVFGLYAFEPNHSDDIIFRQATDSYAVLFLQDYKTKIITDIFMINAFYKYKDMNNESEKELERLIPFYKESATAEEYFSKVLKYLNEVPYFWDFYNKTEKEAAEYCGCEEDKWKENGWQVEIENLKISGNGKGTYYVSFKKTS